MNGGGGVQVVPGDLVQALLLLDRHERGVGDHFPLVVLDEQVVQILREPPELRRGLDVDLVELVEENEALLPGAADEDVEVVQGLPDRHALLHGRVVVDDQLVLRVVGGVEGEQVRHFLAFLQGGHELVGHLSEPLVVGRRIVLSRSRMEKPPAAPKPGTAGGSKNSSFTLVILRHFSSRSTMIWRAVRLRSDQFFRLMIQVPAFEPRPSVRTS